MTAVAQTVDTSKRLAGLRELMNQKENSVKVLVVPSEDQREFCPPLYMNLSAWLTLCKLFSDSSEYVARCDERRAFISGFDGSAGDIPPRNDLRTIF